LLELTVPKVSSEGEGCLGSVVAGQSHGFQARAADEFLVNSANLSATADSGRSAAIAADASAGGASSATGCSAALTYP